MYLPFDTTLYRASFIGRPNRFLVKCRLEESVSAAINAGEIVEAHLADSGRLTEILIPGHPLWLRYVDKPGRKTNFSIVLGATPAGDGFLSLDSTLPNRLIARALKANVMEEFGDWNLIRPEYKQGHSRWDFLLKREDGRGLLLEIKSVTLVEDGIGFFPDAVTSRGARHVRELAEFVRSGDWEGAVLFIVQRDDVREVRPAAEKDPEFTAMLKKAAQAGVSILGRKCQIDKKGVELGEPVPVVIPTL